MAQQFEQAKQAVDGASDKLQHLLQRILDRCITGEEAEAERGKVSAEVEHITSIGNSLGSIQQDDDAEQTRLEKVLKDSIRDFLEIDRLCIDTIHNVKMEEAKQADPKAAVILGNSQSSDNTITPIVLDEEVTSIDLLHGPAVVPSGPTPVGLDNLMQWCHYNSIMQCLCHLPPMSSYVKTYAPLHKTGRCSDLPCSLCHLHNFLQQYSNRVEQAAASTHNTTTAEVASISLLQPAGSLAVAAPRLRAAHNALLCHLSARSGERLMIAEQQDCHETWQSLIHCCAVDHFQACGVCGGDTVAGGERISPLQQVFTGTLQSCLRCSECGCASYTTETFSSLALQVQADDIHDLQTAMSRFIAAEGGVDYTCESCQAASTAATKKLDFVQLPDALVIQLARFKDQDSKIGKHISFQEHIQLPVLNRPNGETTEEVAEEHHLVGYTLCGIVEHLGQSLHFGHYRAFVRVPENPHRTWFEVNDIDVNPKLSFDEVFSVDAYLLFYSRDDTQAGVSVNGAANGQEDMDLGDVLVPDVLPGQDSTAEHVCKKLRMSLDNEAPFSPGTNDFDATRVPDVSRGFGMEP